MRRQRSFRRSGWVVLALLLLGCSRSAGNDAAPSAEPRPTGPGSVEPGNPGEVPAGSAGPILTPEDVEAETEHRITEQNLESELDRLEREIQAE
jgi:hypothetical protein